MTNPMESIKNWGACKTQKLLKIGFKVSINSLNL